MDRTARKQAKASQRTQQPVVDPRYLPKIEVHTSEHEVFIPSVNQQSILLDDSPRSVESGFSGTAPVRSSATTSPVRAKGKKIIVEVSASTDTMSEDYAVD